MIRKKKEDKEDDKKTTWKSKVKVKEVFKKPKVIVVIKERKPENIWEKQNMFFKEFIE